MKLLRGVRVADFSRVVAGPYCTMLLGDLGADVVKVERPGSGDDARSFGPPFVGDESAYFLSLNRNKRSLCLDLSQPEGRRLARALVGTSQVLVENFRPGYMESIGLGYEQLRDELPALIYCSISAFGADGPYRSRAGYDVMVSALGGLMGLTGTPGQAPVKPGVAVLDIMTGLYAYGGILAALLERERSGRGQHVELSLLSVQLATLINAASSFLVAGEVMGPQGNAHAAIVPYQAFRASDGYLIVAAANDKLFAALCDELGHPEWAALPAFRTNPDRVRHREELVRLIEAEMARSTMADWEERLTRRGLPVAPVNRLDQVFHDPQVQRSGQVVTVEHTGLGSIPVVGPAVRFSEIEVGVSAPPPRLGEHTAELRAELEALPASAPAPSPRSADD